MIVPERSVAPDRHKGVQLSDAQYLLSRGYSLVRRTASVAVAAYDALYCYDTPSLYSLGLPSEGDSPLSESTCI